MEYDESDKFEYNWQCNDQATSLVNDIINFAKPKFFTVRTVGRYWVPLFRNITEHHATRIKASCKSGDCPYVGLDKVIDPLKGFRESTTEEFQDWHFDLPY